METLGYCEKHKQAYVIKRIPGSWVYECPACRKEGAYNTYATASTQMLPIDEWTVSNTTNYKKRNHEYGENEI